MTTAITCIEYLTAIMLHIAPRRIPDAHRRLNGRLRVIACGQTFVDLLDAAFTEIRDAAANNSRVLSHLVKGIEAIHAAAAPPERRAALRVHAERLQGAMRTSAQLERDCQPALGVCARLLEEMA